MITKTKIAAAVAIGALFLMANQASAHHRAHSRTNAGPGASDRTYGYVPRQAPQNARARGVYSSDSSGRRDVYSSDSLGRQPFPNPDRDFSIENLTSHAN